MKNYFKSGSWNIICDRCCKKIKAEATKIDWQGFIVCPNCYEQRHPQDFVRSRQDKITIPFIRPVPTLIFTSVSYITIYVEEDYIEDHVLQTYFEEF